MVKNIAANGDSAPTGMTVVGNTLFFVANDGINGPELWQSDGTESGTSLVADIWPGMPNNFDNGYRSSFWVLHAVDNSLFFFTDDGTHGVELWKLDLSVHAVVEAPPQPETTPTVASPSPTGATDTKIEAKPQKLSQLPATGSSTKTSAIIILLLLGSLALGISKRPRSQSSQ
jgi:LPXTG-motif cell wall-anchored protein